MKLQRLVIGALLAQILSIGYCEKLVASGLPDKAPRPGHVAGPTPALSLAEQEKKRRDVTFRHLVADTMQVHQSVTADTISVKHFNVHETTFQNLDVLDTTTTKNLLVTNGARMTGPLDMTGHPILNISTAQAQTLTATGAPGSPAVVLTGQGTTAAAPLRLLGVPNTPLPTDTVLTIDLSGNVINSGVTISGLVGGTSGNVPGAVVQRDFIDGGFAAGTIVASLIGNVTGHVTGDLLGNVSGAASANVLKTGDTMTGALRIANATAPALQLQTNAPAALTDVVLTIDSTGNITQSAVQIGSLITVVGTSGNVPGALVQRDTSGNFAASTITALGFIGDVTGDVKGDVIGSVVGNVTGNVVGNLFGNVFGNVQGNLVGNVLGNVTGNVVGNVLGDVTGNVVGNLLGDVTGNVVGNVSGAASENVLKVGDTMTGQLRVSDTSDAALVATGHSTAQAPALQLLNNPASQSSDVILAIDSSGNVTQSTIPLGLVLSGTSANIPNRLVLRDGSGNFATSAITLNNGSTGYASINQVGNPTTGLYFPAQQQVALTVNSIEQLVATSSGVGIGTATPFTQLTVGQRFLQAGSTGTGNIPYQVFVQNRYAYVVNFSDSTMQVIDVSNPTSPTVLGVVATITNPIAIHVNGVYAYIVGDLGTFQIIDVSNQSKPRALGVYSGLINPKGLYVQGSYAYVISDSGQTFYIIDISNPMHPNGQIGAVDGFNNAEAIFMQGRYAYVPNKGDSPTTSSLQIVDVADPANPRVVGGVNTGLNASTQSVDAQGRYAYVANEGNDTFQVIDVGIVSNPTIVSTITIPGGGQQPSDVFAQGQMVYVLANGSNLIYAIDVSDPANPRIMGSVSTGGTNPRSFFVQGRYAYVINTVNNTLQVIDLGGAYIQQLEAGGIEVATLATRSDAAVGGDLDVQGGVLIGRGLFVAGDAALEGKVTVTGGIRCYDSTTTGAYVGLNAPATVATSYILTLPADPGAAPYQLLAQSATPGQLTWLSATSGNVPLSLALRDGSGNFSANVLTANLLGNVTGNLVGNVLGNVTGNIVGNLFGNVTGNVVGNVSGAASANVLRIGDTMTGQLRVSDVSDAALVATGQGTTQAPALRLVNNPMAQSSDSTLTIDSSGNVTRSPTPIDILVNATSSNVPNTVVQRDGSGNFAAGTITAALVGNVTGNVSGIVTGGLLGNVTGNIFGNVLGNVTGNVVGGLIGNVTGNVVGNLLGDVTGNVVGNVSGAASANVLRIGDTMTGQLRVSDLSDAALVATGQSTTQAPALRLVNNPVAQASDVILTIDSSGNVTRSTVPVDLAANATSGNEPNTLVLRDSAGNFAAGTITAGLLGNVTGNVSGIVTGGLLGNVTGNIFGNVLGNVTGNVVGGLIGNVTGNVVGNLLGDVTGNVVGNVSGAASENVLRVGDTMTGQLRVSDLSDAALVATGQSTTQAPALRLLNNPMAQKSDVLLTIDSSGNVTRSTVPVDLAANATSGNEPNTLVLRDSAGNFSAGTITAGLLGNVTGNVSGIVTGGLLGNVTGNIFGNILGNVTGNVVGGLIGNVTGNVFGNLLGDVTGNVVGNVSGAASANVLRIGDTMTGQLRVSDLATAALVATGQSTTQVPALRLLNNPVAQNNDLFLAIDSSGNVTQATTTVQSLVNATSGAVPNTLVLRDGSGNFAANVLNAQGLDVVGTSTFSNYVYNLFQNVSPNNILYVQKGPITAPNQFNSVKTAVDSIVGNSATNPFVVRVSPGVYVEDTITLKSYVCVRGYDEGTTIIEVNDPNKNLMVGADSVFLRNLTLRGATGSGYAALVLDGGIVLAQNLNFGSNDILFRVRTPGVRPSVVILTFGEILGTAAVTTAFDIQGTNALLPCGVVATSFVWTPESALASGVTAVKLEGPGGFFTGSTLSVGSSSIAPTTGTQFLQLSNGAVLQLASTLVQGFDTAFSVPSASTGPHLNLLSVAATNNTTDISVQDIRTMGSISGAFARSKVMINAAVTGLSVSLLEPASGGISMVGPLSTGRTVDVATNVSPLINDGATLGVMEGGLLFTNPASLVVTVSAGCGYLMQTNAEVDNLTLVSWPTTTTIAIPSADNYVFINNAGMAQVSLSQPSTTYTIPIGKVRAQASSSLFVQDMPSDAAHGITRLNDAFINAWGPVYVSGSSVTGASTLNVTGGHYVFGTHAFAPVGGNGISWQAYQGGTTNQFVGTQTTVDYQQYDLNGVLTPIPANYYARHGFYVIGGVDSVSGATAEQYALVYSQTVTATLPEAEVANSPTKPSTWTGNISPIAAIIVKNGTPQIAEIVDERPLPGFVSSSVSGVTVHANLLGLSADDHKQYLLVNGTRVMVGSLDMGTNAITGADTINTVTIQLHGARHGALGADPIPTGALADIQAIGLTGAAGVNNAFARADHRHAHSNLIGGSLHALATTSVAGFISPADKQLLTNATPANTQGTLVKRDSNGNFTAGTITAGLVGNVTGNVFGNLIGNVFGNVTGNVVGNVSGAASANVLKVGDTMTGQLRISDATLASLIATGHSTTLAPALRLVSNPTAAATDTFLMIDSAGNVTQSTTQVGPLATATSGNVANTLVLRDNSGNFATSAITLNAGSTGATALNFVGSSASTGLYSPGANQLALVLTSTQKLYANSTGIGIGTSAPFTQLTVGGTVALAGSARGTYGVVVKGRYAYTTFGGGTLDVTDVSNPNNPVMVGSVGGMNVPVGLAVQGRYAYVTDTDTNMFHIFDIGNPSSPAIVGSLGGFNSPFSVYVSGSYAYVVNGSDGIFYVIDVSNPTVPTIAGNVSGLTGGFSIYVQGRYAYVACGATTKLQIVDVGNPHNPQLAGSLSGFTGSPACVYVQGRYAYVGDQGGTCSIIDISNPQNPLLVGSLGGMGGFLGIYVQGRYAYLSDLTGFFRVLDVSDPSNPVLVRSISGFSGPFGVYVQGRYAYVTNVSNNVLQIIDLGGAYIQQLEAGGLEAGTVATRENAAIGNDLDVRGGAAVGRSLHVTGDAAFDGRMTTTSSFVFYGATGGQYVGLAAPTTVNSSYTLTLPTDQGTAANQVLAQSASLGQLTWLSATSSNAAHTLVMRDAQGNFAAGTLSAGLQGNVTGNVFGNLVGNVLGNVTGNVVGNVSGAASANVLKIGDTMTGQLRVSDATLAALIATGHSTTIAPALRLVGNPTASTSDNFLTIDSSGNVTQATLQVGALADATSGSVANTLVMRDSAGNFAAGTVTAGLVGNVAGNVTGNLIGNVLGDVTGNVVGNVSGAASANVLKIGDTMTGQLRISDATLASLIATGHSTTAAPALRLVGNPAAAATDAFLTIDSSGNVTQSTTQVGPLATATSGNVANTLVLRDNSGNFATSAITLNAGTTGATALNFAGSAGTGLYSPGANQLALVAANAQKLYANSTGVGIGTSAPFTQLTVGGTAVLSGSTGVPGAEPAAVYVQGRYAYTADQTANTMSIIDVSDANNPAVIATVATGQAPISVYVQGHYAYVANREDGTLSIFNVSNPKSPTLLGSPFVTGGTQPNAVVVQGIYAYVVHSNDVLSVINVGNPASPFIAGSYTFAAGSAPSSLAVQGRYAYTANISAGTMSIIDVSNPTAPQLVGTLSSLSSPRAITVQGRYAYIGTVGDNKILVVDVSNPSNPTFVGSCSAGDIVSAVFVQDRYVYAVAGAPAGILDVVDVNNPTSPTLVRECSGLSVPFGLFVQGRYAYVANNGGGAVALQIIDLGGASLQQLEAGGLEAGTVATRANAAIGNDLDVRGGMAIGRSLQVMGDAAFDGKVTTTSSLVLYNTAGQYVGLKAPLTVTSSYTLSLPTDQGTAADQLLAQSTQGQLAWLSATSGNSANTLVTRDGSGNFAANAMTLSAGTTGVTSLNFVGSAGTGLYSPGTNQFALVANSTPQLYANGTGIGIGTSAPFTQLTVAGMALLAGSTGGLGTLATVYVQGRYVYAVDSSLGKLQVIDVSNPMAPVTLATVSTGGTSPQSVYVQGRYAYVVHNGSIVSDTTLAIFDVSNPVNPVLLGSPVQTGGRFAQAVFVQGRYAYVLNAQSASSGPAVLSVIDVSNPSQPVVIGAPLLTGGTGTGGNSLFVQGRYVYVTNIDRLVIVNVQNPSNPAVVGTLTGLNTPSGVYVQGRYAYVAHSGSDSLTIVDVGNPAAPSIVGIQPTFSAYPLSVYAQGRYVYVVNSSGNSLSIIDVSDPVLPSLIGTKTLVSPRSVFVQGRYAYVGTAGAGMQIVDLGGAYVQQLEAGGIEVGTLATRENAAVGNDLDVRGGAMIGRSLQVAGEVALDGKVTVTGALQLLRNATAASTDNFLTIDGSGNVTHSTSTIASLIAATSGNVANTAVQRDISGNFAAGTVTVNQLGIGTSAPFTQLAVGASPTLAGNVTSGLSQPQSVYVQGRYAYVVNANNNTMSIIDVSDPSSPVVVGTPIPTGLAPQSVYVQGRYAYVANFGSNTMSIIDVGNPSSPSVVGTISSGSSVPQAVYVQGRYAYVVNSSGLTMLVIDVSNPSSPLLVGTISTSGLAPQAVYVQGRYAYVVKQGSDTLSIIDVRDPSNPLLVGTVSTSGFGAQSVYVQGRYAYVTNMTDNTLSIIDVSNPSSPSLVGTPFPTSGSQPYAVYVQGRYAYVANANSQTLSIIDVSNPSSPALVATPSSTGGFGPHSLVVQGRYAYVANFGSNSFRIIDLGGAYTQQLETGGIETGTLATRDNCAIGNDLDVKGGAVVGRNLEVSGQITAINASSTLSIPYTSPLRLVNVSTGSAFDQFLTVDTTGNVRRSPNSLSSLYLIRDGAGNATAGGTMLNAGTTGALAINFSGNTATGLYAPGTDQLALVTNNTQQLYANSTGVGIGTSAPFTQLTVDGSLALAGSTGATGGGGYEVFVQGRYAYRVNFSNNSMEVIDVSVPTNPTLIATLTGLNGPLGVKVLGRYAYIVSNSGDFNVVDISNPARPVIVSTLSGVLGCSYGIYVQGRYAYVAEACSPNKLEIIDVSNPKTPTLVGGAAFPGTNIRRVFVQGRYAYCVGDGSVMAVYDVGNPTQPTLVQSVTTSANPYGIYVQGRYAYVTTLDSSFLQIFDISNPGSIPAAVANLYLAVATPYSIFVQGRYAYIASFGSHKLQVVDVSTPTNPVVVRVISTGASSDPLFIFVQGRYLYASNNNFAPLQVYDLGGSYIQQLEAGGIETGTLATRSNAAFGNDLDVKGGTVFGRGLEATGSSSVLGDFVVTNTNIAPLQTVSVASSGLVPEAVCVQGRYAYFLLTGSGGSGVSGLYVYDVSNPANMTLIGSLALGGSTDVFVHTGISVQGRYAYCMDLSNSVLYVVDISNPATPVQVGSLATTTSPTGLYVQGRYAYIGFLSTTALYVIDISNPATPLLVSSSLSLPGLNNRIYVQGRYAYAASYNSGTLQIIDVSNPTAPLFISSIATAEPPGSPNAHFVALQGRYAYTVSTTTNNLQVIDVSNPAAPSRKGSVTTGANPTDIKVQGRYAYVTAYSGSVLQIFDVNDPSNPISVASLPTTGNPLSLQVQGRYVYVCNAGGNAIQSFDLGGAYIQQLEAGGIECSTLATRSNAAIGNDFDVKGGMMIGRNLAVQGQITSINASGATGTALTSPLRLVNIPSGTFGSQLAVDTAGNVGINPSSVRFKEHITPLTTESDLLYSLTPVKYDYKPEYGGGKDFYGFIAEELAQAYPTIINYDSQGRINNYRTPALHALTINELQKHKQKLVTHAQEVDSHTMTLEKLLHTDSSLQSTIKIQAGQLVVQRQTLESLLATIASMQQQLGTLQKRA